MLPAKVRQQVWRRCIRQPHRVLLVRDALSVAVLGNADLFVGEVEVKGVVVRLKVVVENLHAEADTLRLSVSVVVRARYVGFEITNRIKVIRLVKGCA